MLEIAPNRDFVHFLSLKAEIISYLSRIPCHISGKFPILALRKQFWILAMRHFPIFLDLRDARVVVSGAGEVAVAKLRLLLKTESQIDVFGTQADPVVLGWAAEGRISLADRALEADDLAGAKLLYAANDDAHEDGRVLALGKATGVLTNVVDNLNASEFITPAIVDRDPVTIAIGTEGAAPVLARKIKADLEASLPSSLGALTRIGRAFRARANMLPMGRIRRDFWSKFFFERGPEALRTGGAEAAEAALYDLLGDGLTAEKRDGRVALVGAGPGDPDLLTRRAAALLHEADVVIHDRLVSKEVLELARREAIVIEAGKTGFGQSWDQDDINAEMVKHARAGHQVVRLKGGDPVIFGRLDEEMTALGAAEVPFEVVPGITTASAAAAALNVSLTSRGRNSSLRIITAHDMKGFVEADWRELARPGGVAAIYMGKKAARFVQGRLLMHGADGATPITAVENVSRVDQRVIASTLGTFGDDLGKAAAEGPVVILYGIAPRAAAEIDLNDVLTGAL